MLTRAKELTQTDASPAQRLRALRLHCLLEVLYATGLRVSELVSLPQSAARRDIRMIVVRGKGDKSGWCRSMRPPPGDGRLSGGDGSHEAGEEESRAIEMAVSLLRRKRTFDAPAFCPRP